MRDLYYMLCVQLSGSPLNPSLQNDDECFHALELTCQGRSVLLVIDDPWKIENKSMNSTLYTATGIAAAPRTPQRSLIFSMILRFVRDDRGGVQPPLLGAVYSVLIGSEGRGPRSTC